MLSFSLAMVMTATATPDTAKHRKTSQLIIVRRNSSINISCLDKQDLSVRVRSPARHTDFQGRTGFTPSNLTLFHLRALLGHRNAADEEDDDSAPDDEMDFFYVTVLLSLRPALLAHNEVVIQSQPHALPRNLDPPFRTCLKRRQTGRRLRLPPGDSTD